METPPKTGSEAFDVVKIPEGHPSDGDLHDHQDAQIQIGTDPADGLPRMTASPWGDKLAPALDPETLLCMEDASQYVLRDAGRRIVASFAPAEIRWRDDGATVVSRVTALARLDPPAKSGARPFYALGLAIEGLRQGGDVVVEPVRPKCVHYARQMVDFPGDLEHRIVVRLCTAKRTDNGEFESLSNAQMHACELREPRDVRSEKLLRAFDDKVVKAGRERQKVHMFSVEAELRSASLEQDESGGGIFNQQ